MANLITGKNPPTVRDVIRSGLVQHTPLQGLDESPPGLAQHTSPLELDKNPPGLIPIKQPLGLGIHKGFNQNENLLLDPTPLLGGLTDSTRTSNLEHEQSQLISWPGNPISNFNFELDFDFDLHIDFDPDFDLNLINFDNCSIKWPESNLIVENSRYDLLTCISEEVDITSCLEPNILKSWPNKIHSGLEQKKALNVSVPKIQKSDNLLTGIKSKSVNLSAQNIAQESLSAKRSSIWAQPPSSTLFSHFIKSEEDSLQKFSTKYKSNKKHNSEYPNLPMLTYTAPKFNLDSFYDIGLTQRDNFHTHLCDSNSSSLSDIKQNIEVSSHLSEHVMDYQLDYPPCQEVELFFYDERAEVHSIEGDISDIETEISDIEDEASDIGSDTDIEGEVSDIESEISDNDNELYDSENEESSNENNSSNEENDGWDVYDEWG